MIDYDVFERNLAGLRKRLATAEALAGRVPGGVSLLPVTKTHPAEAVCHAVRAGLAAVGENRVREAVEKRAALAALAVRWELIGHLQSNKAKPAVETFDRIQSVDSIKLLERLDRLAGEARRRLPVLLEFNTGEDPNKYGFAVADGEAALEAALGCEQLVVEGLMTVAPLEGGRDAARRAFERLRELRDGLAARAGHPLPELSMGMTGDLEEAVAAGSTQVRVGTALFGAREPGVGE